MTSWEAIEKELKKCVLLCSNCHREVHDGLHPNYLQDESHMRGDYDGDDRQLDMFENFDGLRAEDNPTDTAPPPGSLVQLEP